jgi:hypothetical protein
VQKLNPGQIKYVRTLAFFFFFSAAPWPIVDTGVEGAAQVPCLRITPTPHHPLVGGRSLCLSAAGSVAVAAASSVPWTATFTHSRTQPWAPSTEHTGRWVAPPTGHKRPCTQFTRLGHILDGLAGRHISNQCSKARPNLRTGLRSLHKCCHQALPVWQPLACVCDRHH